MKSIIILTTLINIVFSSFAQETLQTVTDRGNITTNSLQIGGYSVNSNTTKLFINNPYAKNFALSSGANMISEHGFHIYNWTDNPNSPLLSLSNNGNLGVGIHNPKAKLDVNGNILISSAAIPMGLITEFAGTTTPLLNMSANFREENKDNAYVGGGFRIDTRGEHVGAPLFQWISRHANSTIETVEMSLTSSGFLGIGTLVPRERLSVNGNIRAKEVKVETANWPDYVFTKGYQLPTIQEIENHIKEKGHLQGVPSASEVKANGIDLGEMNAKLLQKIEELTLHLIEQNKTNSYQTKAIKELQDFSKNQHEEIKRLKNQQ